MFGENNDLIRRHFMLPILKDTILTILDLRLHRMPSRANDEQVLVRSQTARDANPTDRLLDTLFRSELTAGRGNRIKRQILTIPQGLANFMQNFGCAKLVHILQQLQLIHAKLQPQFRLKTRDEAIIHSACDRHLPRIRRLGQHNGRVNLILALHLNNDICPVLLLHEEIRVVVPQGV